MEIKIDLVRAANDESYKNDKIDELRKAIAIVKNYKQSSEEIEEISSYAASLYGQVVCVMKPISPCGYMFVGRVSDIKYEGSKVSEITVDHCFCHIDADYYTYGTYHVTNIQKNYIFKLSKDELNLYADILKQEDKLDDAIIRLLNKTESK